MVLSTAFVTLSLLILASATAPEVEIGKTTLIGREISTFDQEFFGGIPFALPPVGGLRLQSPVLQTTLNATTFDASNFGPGCFQAPGTQSIPPLSEDCLTINILRPAGLPSNASLPVMAWIYGGGFITGSATIYNGSTLVAQSVSRGTPVIYVNFNYRLGPLGFPQGNEAEAQGALNLGLKDQIAALQWIQSNIGLFGGDESKVTVFGESAGAISIAIHLLDPDFGQLARAAILESGSAGTTCSFPASRNQDRWAEFVSGVPSCASIADSNDTFSCLQAADSEDILESVNLSLINPASASPFPPVLDGTDGVFPDSASSLIAQEHFARIPFITGTNLDEGTLFVLPTVNSTEELNDWIISNLTASATPSPALQSSVAQILDLYPDNAALGSPFNTGNETFGLSSQFKRLSAIAGDILFQSLRRQWIQSASNASVKTYGYLLTDPQPTFPPYLGVTHTSEIPYVYGSVNTSSASERLSDNIIDYWVSFATSLDPNDGLGTQRPNWTQYTSDNQVLLQLDGTNLMLIPDNYRAQQLEFIISQSSIYSR